MAAGAADTTADLAAARTAATGPPRRGALRPTVARELVEAARALMWETGAPVFTVTQVVAAAGTSLKSFYRCFESKDELLVALFEDDARTGAVALAGAVDGWDDPVARVRCAVEGLFRFITPEGRLPYAAALVREHLRLSESRPSELRAVLQPFVDIFRVELDAAGRSGALKVDDPARTARTLFHLVVSHLHALICHQIEENPTDVADELWAFCAAALRP
jgi:TetR/AcrR family transcriptional regulator